MPSPTWLQREVLPSKLRPVPRMLSRALKAALIFMVALSPSVVTIVTSDRLSMMPTVAIDAPRGFGTGSRSQGANNESNTAFYADASGAQTNIALRTGPGDVYLNTMSGTYDTTAGVTTFAGALSTNFTVSGRSEFRGDILVHGRITFTDDDGHEVTLSAEKRKPGRHYLATRTGR